MRYEMHIYPGTQHGFHNNSTPRYNEAAAKLAWERTIAFFKKYIGKRLGISAGEGLSSPRSMRVTISASLAWLGAGTPTSAPLRAM